MKWFSLGVYDRNDSQQLASDEEDTDLPLVEILPLLQWFVLQIFLRKLLWIVR